MNEFERYNLEKISLYSEAAKDIISLIKQGRRKDTRELLDQVSSLIVKTAFSLFTGDLQKVKSFLQEDRELYEALNMTEKINDEYGNELRKRKESGINPYDDRLHRKFEKWFAAKRTLGEKYNR